MLCYAKSLQSCPTLCDRIDGSPPGSPVPGIIQARTLEWVAISSSNAWKWKVKVKLLSCVRLLATPWTAAYQAPPSMGFSRQEYWSGVPLPSPSMDIPHCIVFHRIAFFRSCSFYKLKVCGNPVSSKSKGATFPLHVCLILVSLKIFQFFYYFYIWYGDLWSVIFDIMVVIFGRGGGHHKPCPYEMVNLTSKRFVCSDWSVDQTFPQLSPSPGAFSFPEIQQH